MELPGHHPEFEEQPPFIDYTRISSPDTAGGFEYGHALSEITAPGPDDDVGYPSPESALSPAEHPSPQTAAEIIEAIAGHPDEEAAEAADHIGILPGNEHVFYRTFPDEHHGYQTFTPEEAEHIVSETLTHHALLAGLTDGPDTGIVIPNVYYQPQTSTKRETVYSEEEGTTETDVTSTTITSIVERVEGEQITSSRLTPDVIIPEHLQGTVAQQLEHVLRYYGTIVNGDFDSYLQDIASPRQYLANADGRPVLVDVDPFISSLRYREGWHNLAGDMTTALIVARQISDQPTRERIETEAKRIIAACEVIIQGLQGQMPYSPKRPNDMGDGYFEH